MEPYGPVQVCNGIHLLFFFLFTSAYFRPICNCSDCTAPNGMVGTNYATEGHCTMLSLPILHSHLIICMQGFRTIRFRTYRRIRKFHDTGTNSWYTKDDTDTGKYLIAKCVLMYSQSGGPLMIMLRETLTVAIQYIYKRVHLCHKREHRDTEHS